MVRLYLLQLLGLMTFLTDIRASGRETAARLRIDRRCDLPFQLYPLTAVMDICRWDGRQQRLCIRVQGIDKQLLRW